MAVQPVKYTDTSGAGADFAVKDTCKEINSSTADQIYRDCMQGKTEINSADLKESKKAQAIELNNLVDSDNVNYSSEEARNIGKDQIETKDAQQHKGAEAATGAAATISSAGGLAGLITILAVGTAADGFTQLAASGVVMAMGLTAAGTAAAFDFMPDQQNLKAQTDAAEANNATIDAYADQMATCMETMAEEQAQYEELAAEKLELKMTNLDNSTALKAEQATYINEGNLQKANSLQQSIDNKTETDAEQESAFDEQMDPLKENLDGYSDQASEALGVKDSGNQVAQFLHVGKALGAVATTNAVLNGASTLVAAGMTLAWWPKLGPIDGAANLAAKIMLVVGVAGFGAATYLSYDAAKKDFAADKAGTEMDKHINNLGNNASGAEGFVNDTAAAYANSDGASAEAYQEASEGAAEMIANTKKGESKSEAPVQAKK